MKKSCDKCKALEDVGSNILKLVCELGYEQERGVPKEQCPKPLTTKKFVEELRKHKK